MMFTRSLFDGRRWTGHLVEDAELQNELLLEGQLVTYAPDAVLWAEMPESRVSGNEPEPSMGAWPHRAGPAVRAEASRRARRGAAAVGSPVSTPSSITSSRRSRCSRPCSSPSPASTRSGRRSVTGPRGPPSSSMPRRSLRWLRTRSPVSRRWGPLPPDTRRLLSAPRLVAWKVGVWIKALRPSEEVEWTRTTRNMETSLRSAETSR